MEFVHRSYQPHETIAAIATPPGDGGIAIVRITGDKALSVAEKLIGQQVFSWPTHTAHTCKIRNVHGDILDHALALVMLGKRSYCGEDTIELHCHGGGLIAKRVLEVAIEAGARAAYPGEFTFKAFMNGKIDLAQAEAVQQLIGAKNDLALHAAKNHLEGSFSKKIRSFQERLCDIAGILEAWVDFPEEGLEFASLEEVALALHQIVDEMDHLIATFDAGKIMHEGISLCLAGRPNVGKSSLMNCLLDKERAIVTPIAGTTRDILEDTLYLGNLHVKLTDTAGIRETSEVIEKEGIRRSYLALHEADLVLFVVDATTFCDADIEILAKLPNERTIVVWNKIDLPHEKIPDLDVPAIVSLSAKEKMGLKDLKEAIDRLLWKKGPPAKEEVVLTNIRHKEALARASKAAKKVIDGLQQGLSPEFVSFEMRTALKELGTIIGHDITDDVLSAIFSRFCIGK